MLWGELYRGGTVVGLVAEVSSMTLIHLLQPLCHFSKVNKYMLTYPWLKQHRRRIQPSLLGNNRHHLAPFPRSSPQAKPGAPAPLQKLDVSLRPDSHDHTEHCPHPSAGLDVLQPRVQGCGFPVVLCPDSDPVCYAAGLEAV